MKNTERVPEADVIHYIGLDFQLVNNDNYNHPVYYPAFGVKGNDSTFRGVPSPQMNHISFKLPSVPLLTQSQEISEFELCSFESTMAVQEHCKKEYCECTHVLHVEIGKVTLY